MYTDYSKVLHFFKNQAANFPNTDVRDIWFKFAEIKCIPNDIKAARYLMDQYQEYTQLLRKANVNVS